jgi:hypothetical protein
MYTYIHTHIYYILFVGKHPFVNVNGIINHEKQKSGEYEKVKEERYSSALINLMERMMVVCICFY